MQENIDSPAPAPAKTALVAGSTGVAGASLVDTLAKAGWQVLALSRSAKADPRDQVTSVAADLLDPRATARALQDYGVTHVFYAVQYRGNLVGKRNVNTRQLKTLLRWTGRMLPVLRAVPTMRRYLYHRIAMESGAGDPQGHNLAMFTGLLDALQGHPLEHVAIVTGGKQYGMHLGPGLYPEHALPYKEDETPRAPGPNWYYELEDHLLNRAPAWSWSVVRPSFIVGSARNAPYNLGTTLAVYASLRKARGEPLVFFGDQEAYECLWEVSGARQLAALLLWTADTPGANRQAFNCTSGTPFRWSELWPQIADYFGMEPAVNGGIRTHAFFRANQTLWSDLVRRHRLEPHALESLASDDFIDRAMTIDWDVVYCTQKLRAAGFDYFPSPLSVFTSLFDELRAGRVIP